jgi:hypothetical protein
MRVIGCEHCRILKCFPDPDGGPTREIFLEMTPLEAKICGESEFNIFEAKKRFSDSGKAYCILKRKVAKMRFLPENF